MTPAAAEQLTDATEENKESLNTNKRLQHLQTEREDAQGSCLLLPGPPSEAGTCDHRVNRAHGVGRGRRAGFGPLRQTGAPASAVEMWRSEGRTSTAVFSRFVSEGHMEMLPQATSSAHRHSFSSSTGTFHNKSGNNETYGS